MGASQVAPVACQWDRLQIVEQRCSFIMISMPPVEPAGEGEYVIRDGDGIGSIAAATGHFRETLWNDSANGALREARGAPEVLLPGDRVTIPPLRPKTVAMVTGKRHICRRRGVPSRFQLRLLTGGQPRAGVAYTLTIDDALTLSGQSDVDGWIRVWVPRHLPAAS
jgi:hypothetical protein